MKICLIARIKQGYASRGLGNVKILDSKFFFYISACVEAILGPKSNVCVCAHVRTHIHKHVYRRYPSPAFLPIDLTQNHLSNNGVR